MYVVAVSRSGYSRYTLHARDSNGERRVVVCNLPVRFHTSQRPSRYLGSFSAVDFKTQRVVALYETASRPPAGAALYNGHFDMHHRHCVERDHAPADWWDLRGKQPDRAERPPPRLALLVFDIECLPGPAGEFPEARGRGDPVVQISAAVRADALRPRDDDELHLWTLGDVERPLPRLDEFDPAGVRLHPHDTEAALLDSFADFVRASDPDLISGWNVRFDVDYVCDRSRAAREKLSAVRDQPCERRRDHYEVPGRVVADLLQLWRGRYRERSYKLDAVAEAHLGASKAPVRYSEMRELQATPAGRARMGTYCAKDTHLVLRLADRMDAWQGLLQLARACRLLPQQVLDRGQQAKVLSLLSARCRHFDPRYAIPDSPDSDTNHAGYEGALVLDPVVGLHDRPVAVLDFESLYPSVMRAFNLCYTTLRLRADAEDVRRALGLPERAAERVQAFLGQEDLDAKAFPAHPLRWHRIGDEHFRRQPQGVLPRILEELHALRKAEKRRLKQATDPAKRAVHNAVQLSLKLMANSVYGFTGARTGVLTDLRLPAAVTRRGRELLRGTKHQVQSAFGKRVVYGDSVASDTPLLVRSQGGHVDVVRIDEVARETDWEERDDGKEVARPQGLEVWCDGGWTAVRAVVRHAHDGALFRVGTGGGVVDVTAHHSLLRADASPCKPADVKRGDELLHEPLPAMPHLPENGSGLSGDAQAARALFERRVARGRPPPWMLVSRSKLEVAEACALAAKVGGLRASVHARRDGRIACVLSRGARPAGRRVRAVHALPREPGRQVYDLTTDSAHFAVLPGVEPLVVHNTDSVFVELGANQGEAEAESMARAVNQTFPRPVNLEFEKIYHPLLLVGRKMYAGMKEEGGRTCFAASGLHCCRTDNFPLLAKTQKDVLDALVSRQDAAAALEIAGAAVHRLRTAPEEGLDLAELAKSQQLTKDAEEYAGALPHVTIARRTPGVRKGDRVEYLLARGRGTLAERAHAPAEWDRARHALDREYYAGAIDSACRRILLAASAPADVSRALARGRGTTVATQASPLLRAWGRKREHRTTLGAAGDEGGAEPKRTRQLTLAAVLR